MCDPRSVGINPLVKQLWDKYMPLPNDLTTAAGDGFKPQGYLTGLKLPERQFWRRPPRPRLCAKCISCPATVIYHLERFYNNQYDVGGLLGGTFGVASPRPKRRRYPGISSGSHHQHQP